VTVHTANFTLGYLGFYDLPGIGMFLFPYFSRRNLSLYPALGCNAERVTQAKLQRAADVNSRTMSDIWHDPYRRVTYEMLMKVARALSVEVADLVEEEPD
jgi:DNA-binding Xre family transcriptional regulator